MMTPYTQQYHSYSPLFQQNSAPVNSSVFDTGIIWVQGESGAKAYPVAPGKSMALFDSESEQFYIKSVDISGMPQPLRVFVYSEQKETDHIEDKIDTSVFITREEFKRTVDELNSKYGQRPLLSENRGGNKNGKSTLQSTEQ